MANFLSRLFNEDARKLKQIQKKIKPVLDLEEEYKAKSDDELKAMTPYLREKLAAGATLDDIFVEAFATAREACRRVIGEFPYPVQLMGAAVMQGGDIAEMKTGEGKTLTSVMAVYLNALEGKGVHVVTVNEYLSERDSAWMGEIHRFLGLTVGLNLRQLTKAQKRAAYACDITYTTNSELGFDYLRDNMVTRVEDRVLRGLNVAMVDEVDSILIDESRTPLIISGGKKDTANLYLQADRFVKRLVKDEDYELDVKSRTVQLTEKGTAKAEATFRIENLFNLAHTQLLHHINQALKANYVMLRDIEYVVDEENDEIVIVDPNTGRLMKGRQWSDGLHQAVEAKEGISIKQETTTLATITYQNFFRLYNKLCGMTGTAKTEEEEFLEIYNMYVFEIPTNRPVARIDYPDAVYGTKKAKFNALVDEVVERHAAGQPVLVGTIAVETSELISKYLKERHIPHEVLNAKNNAREADIIAKAGQKGAVTIATNMAGRGTDIKLGEGVAQLGGLAVLGSERHEAKRIDNQLRGRSGRQGDPGFSRFYCSMDDDLIVEYHTDESEGMIERFEHDKENINKMRALIDRTQERAEGLHFDTRKNTLEYDDVLMAQRHLIYDQRDKVLDLEDMEPLVYELVKENVSAAIEGYYQIPNKNDAKEKLAQYLNSLGIDGKQYAETIHRGSQEEITDAIIDVYHKQTAELPQEELQQMVKFIFLQILDREWIHHVDVMEHLKTSVRLRSYANVKPIDAYREEGFNRFNAMMQNISEQTVSTLLHIQTNNESAM